MLMNAKRAAKNGILKQFVREKCLFIYVIVKVAEEIFSVINVVVCFETNMLLSINVSFWLFHIREITTNDARALFC